MKRRKQSDTIEVFRCLGLETELDRQRLRQLARLGLAETREAQATVSCAETWNNTKSEEDDAQLEPAA
jgi:hypothetical protein